MGAILLLYIGSSMICNQLKHVCTMSRRPRIRSKSGHREVDPPEWKSENRNFQSKYWKKVFPMHCSLTKKGLGVVRVVWKRNNIRSWQMKGWKIYTYEICFDEREWWVLCSNYAVARNALAFSNSSIKWWNLKLSPYTVGCQEEGLG